MVSVSTMHLHPVLAAATADLLPKPAGHSANASDGSVSSAAPAASPAVAVGSEPLSEEEAAAARQREERRSKLVSKIQSASVGGGESDGPDAASIAAAAVPTVSASAAVAASSVQPSRRRNDSVFASPSHRREGSPASQRRAQMIHDRLTMYLLEVFDWLRAVVGDHESGIRLTEPVDPDALFACIESGAVPCMLVQRCQEVAAEKGKPDSAPTIVFKRNAKHGSFQARDNLAQFLAAVQRWGMPAQQLFEVDDLVLRKNGQRAQWMAALPRPPSDASARIGRAVCMSHH